MEVGSSTPPKRPRMTYDVFISFRGEDTRNTFVGFLYEALRQLGIMTFMDDKKLLIGDNLSEKLVKAIQESRSSIVVLSKDYASSKWCLKELTKIVDCMAETAHRVLPVFYHVDPSDVRHQSGSFKKSFEEHEETAQKFIGEQKEKYLVEVQNWKDSMTKIGNLSGEVVTEHSPEVDIVRKLTNQIFELWRPKLVTSDKNLVGMTNQLLRMNVQLGLGLDDVRFVAIVGMGGIGKTTIAKVVYDCIASKFEGSCFLRVSRGGSKQSNLVSLQDQLLSRLILKENVRIWDEDYGAEMIENQLRGRKVLLVLDGVEEKKQLEMLAGSPDWFGPGSRVIITTRSKQVLRQPYEILEYKVELLDADSALQLFCNRAFEIDYIDNNFMNLSKEMVEKLGRLPLALKVIGSYLNKKDEVIWKETLNRLIKVDEKYFFEVLKISYDGLGVESQKVFLDLACFFHGRRKDKMIEIFESFGYSPYSELHLLTERCLIEVSHTNIIMHDLIVALGQEIVHREFLTQPGKQSRIWLQEDVNRVFTVKHGLKYTEGIVLNLEKKQKELTLEAESFADMTCLRILEISNVQLLGNIEYLSNLLGFLHWPGYPSKCLPSSFQSGYLLELHLPRSSIVRLWEGKKRFEKLKVIDASDSKHLLETPDFSEVPNLERLVLRKCRQLYHIHPSINDLNRLTFLDLRECSSLKSFSSNLRCKNLGGLILCKSGLTSSPEFEGNMEHLSELHLDGTPIEQLHSSIGCLVGLVLLDLRNCIMLSSLPSEIGNLKSLEILLLEGCANLDQIPPSLENAQRLRYLDIGKTSIRRAPPTIHSLKNLKRLNCDGLSRSIWHSLLPPSDIPWSNLEISGSEFGLKSLEYLTLKGCNLVDEDIPEDLHCFSSLKALDLSGNHIVQLPESINHLGNLKRLILDDCFKLQHMPEPPTNLVPIVSSTEYGMPTRSFPIYYQHDKHFTLEFLPKINFNFDPKASEEFILKGAAFVSISDKAEVLECFDEIREGNCVEVDYDRVKNDANNIYGVVLSACIQGSEITRHKEVITFYCKLLIELETDANPDVEVLSKTLELTSRTRIWTLFIPFHMLPKSTSMQKSFSSFKATIKCVEPFVNVEMCGASVLSHQNAPKFLVNMFTTMCCNQDKFHMAIRGCNHGSECSCDELEAVEHYSSTQSVENESDSFSLLKRNLKPMLRRTYEEGKYFSPCYFFPQGEVSSWFRIQQPTDTVAMKLPRNLYREKKWMGLAVFAIFSVQENSKFVQNHCFSIQIDSDDGDLRKGGSYTFHSSKIRPLLLSCSQKILHVVFEPRSALFYIQDKSNHLYVSFITNAARLRVELCGARLVYQHNVEGLIHTIVDCVLKSGQKSYQSCSQKILADLLLTYHQPIVWNRVTGTGNEPSTSTSSDPSRHLSTEKLLHESFQHPLSMESIQDRYESKFNAIIHGKEIPDFFTCQSMGNEGRIRIPETSNFTKRDVGILVCAVVAINKELAKLDRIPEPRRRIRVLHLKSDFGVDSREVEPNHHLFLHAEELLCQSETSSFIWLFFLPFSAFEIPWSCCNYFGSKVSTNDDDELFHVEQCGLHLLRKTETKMVDNLLMMSMLPPPTHNHKLRKTGIAELN